MALQKPSIIPSNTFSRLFKPLLKQVPMRIHVSKSMKDASMKMVDSFVDSVFQIVGQELFPLQKNFAPVDELEEKAHVTNLEGEFPLHFPEGVYVRNGPNPLFGGLKSAVSIFGKSSELWVEGEGMLHALYFGKDSNGKWTAFYNNKHVETQTFLQEKQRNQVSFLPAGEGQSPAILSAILLNILRFGKVYKDMCNTSIFEHSGKLYTVSEHHLPYEFDVSTLATLSPWDVHGAWNRSFTSHPKKAPGTGELVISGVQPIKPFMEVGVISSDGKLVHRVDVKLNRCTLLHEIGVTQRYNVIMDFPLTIDLTRLIRGGSLVKYNSEEYARIGVMPRYGDADSVKWFDVESNSTLHILNSFEDGNEVVLWDCKALASIIPGPDYGLNKFEWFSRGFKPFQEMECNLDNSSKDGFLFTRAYEWRLNMENGHVKEKNLTGTKFSMDFPIINPHFTGIKNKFGYTQVVDSIASSTAGMAKFGGLAKLYFEEAADISSGETQIEELIKVEQHVLEKHTYCSGAVFVPKDGGVDEDDGWILTFVHNEDTNISQVYLIDTKKFSSEPIVKMTLPSRVPYGFHGAFFPFSL